MKRQLCLFAALIAAILLAGCGPAVATTATATNPSPPSTTATETPTEKATASETPQPLTGVCSPLADHALTDLSRYITQAFIAPQGENKERGHHGVDFAYYRRDGVGEHIDGTPIQSVLNGTMAGLGYNPVYGNYLIIETRGELLPPDLAALYAIQEGQSLYLLYAHMQDLAPFEIREPLDCRQVIGYVGGSGDPFFVSDPHLHLETRVAESGMFVEPMSFYDTQATEEEKASYMLWRSSGTFMLVDPMILLDYGAAHEAVNG